MGKAAQSSRRGGAGRTSPARRSASAGITAPPTLAQAAIDARGRVSIERVVERLGMTKQQFGGMAGLSAETLRKSARAEAPKTQERMRETIEIIDRVREWAGGEAHAVAWYKSEPIPGFGGRTAESLVKSGEATALRDYLDHIAMGGFA